MGTVFINYRRDETAGEARALFNELVEIVGKNSVFMDVDNIALGRDFRQALHERLTSCDLMLVLIGRNWVDAKDESGRLRLEDPNDFVRLEISAALKRNIPVTPVLVQGARIPAAERVPDDLKDLVYRNGFELNHSRWESDVREMIRRLGLDTTGPAIVEPVKEAPPNGSRAETLRVSGGASTTPIPTRRRWPVLLGSLLAIAIAGGGFLYLRGLLPDVSPDSHPSLGEASPDTPIKPADYQVFVQFAGVIQRDDVIAMSHKLSEKGWRVQGADRGGERTGSAAGYNEVRYSPGDEAAAKALARLIQEANLVPNTIAVTPASGIDANTLEVWISR
jgi:TIR domain